MPILPDNYSLLFQLLCAVLGLMVGSFLNVVIYRLPYMITCGQPAANFNLCFPRSHCPKCKQSLGLTDNIPVLSYLWLKGCCRYCKGAINPHYPAVELVSGLLSWFAAFYFGFSTELFAALIFFWALLALTVIDMNHQLLPDAITLPLLWLGLIVNTKSLFVSPDAAILGAVFGYLILWMVYWLFKVLTKKEGMGYGDFKLLAALGAWCGWESLPVIIFLSSLLGSIAGIFLIITYHRSRHIPLAFGPWLAIAGVIAFTWKDTIEQLWFNMMGLHLTIW